MKLIDANILLYLANVRSAQHRQVVHWWEALIESEERVGFPWIVLLGFLRISTNPVTFPKPLDPDTAMEVVDTWLALDQARVIHESEEHWEILRSLIIESGTAGNLTTDAHLAALAISHGAVLASCDNDFARFKGLRWENPLQSV